MCKYIKLDSNKSLWRMKGLYLLWKRKMQEDFQTEGKDFDLWAADQLCLLLSSMDLHLSSDLLSNASQITICALCHGRHGAAHPVEAKCFGSSVAGKSLKCANTAFTCSSNRTEPSLYLFFILKMPFFPLAVFFGFACLFFFFPQTGLWVVLVWVKGIFAQQGKGDPMWTENGWSRWEKFSVSWKGLRVDWELPLRQQNCTPPASIGRLVRSQIFWWLLLHSKAVAILNPVDTFRYLFQVPLPSRKHDGSDPVVPSISRHLLHGGLILGYSWWLTSRGTSEKGMVTVLVAASGPKRGKWTTRQLCKSNCPHGTTLREILSGSPWTAAILCFGSGVCLHYPCLKSILVDSKSSLPSLFILRSSNICLNPLHFHLAVPQAPIPLSLSSVLPGLSLVLKWTGSTNFLPCFASAPNCYVGKDWWEMKWLAEGLCRYDRWLFLAAMELAQCWVFVRNVYNVMPLL